MNSLLSIKRNRAIYVTLVFVTIILGLSSRIFSKYLPVVIGLYTGDIFWALMVYLGFCFLFDKLNYKIIAVISLVFSYAIEFSQLYQGQWINNLRSTIIGGLILGHGFLFSDLICYTVGISIGVIIDIIIIKKLFLINKEL